MPHDNWARHVAMHEGGGEKEAQIFSACPIDLSVQQRIHHYSFD